MPISAKTVSTRKKGVPTVMTKKRKKKIDSQKIDLLPTKNMALRFSPTAWAKLLFLRDYGKTEVGGFGITAKDDLLLVEDIQLVGQVCSWAHVAFNDESVADFFDEQVDRGHAPEQFARIWVHTHPGDCPRPSQTDEETFERVFGLSDWAVMFILAAEGQAYARLRFNVGPRAEMEVPIEIDYSRVFSGCDLDSWEQEYLANVQPQRPNAARELECNSSSEKELTDAWHESWLDYSEDRLEELVR